MKTTFAVMSLVLSLGAFAQERVELNASEVTVKGSEAVVVRTNRTPEKVKISFEVPMASSICEEYDTRLVYRTSGIHCGYEVRYRRVPTRGPRNPNDRRDRGGYTTERYEYPRTCLVRESVCVRYGTSTEFKRDTMTIKFKDLPALADSESDTFQVTANQNNYNGGNVVYVVKTLETVQEYKVEQKNILGFKTDDFVIKLK